MEAAFRSKKHQLRYGMLDQWSLESHTCRKVIVGEREPGFECW